MEKEGEKPFRYKRKLAKVGNSFYILCPQSFRKKMNGVEVIVEEYSDKIIIIPENAGTVE